MSEPTPEFAAWQKTRERLRLLLERHYEPGVISMRAAAAAIGVRATLVQSWVRDANCPIAEEHAALVEWLDRHDPRLDETPTTFGGQ